MGRAGLGVAGQRYGRSRGLQTLLPWQHRCAVLGPGSLLLDSFQSGAPRPTGPPIPQTCRMLGCQAATSPLPALAACTPAVRTLPPGTGKTSFSNGTTCASSQSLRLKATPGVQRSCLILEPVTVDKLGCLQRYFFKSPNEVLCAQTIPTLGSE